jgi:hypothetical protein
VAGLSSEAPSDPRIPISHVVSDPIASIISSPIDVALLGRRWVIPAMPASSWLQVLMAKEPDLWDIIPGMCDEAELLEDQLTDAMLDDQISFQQITDLCTQTLELASGRPWWVTIRLVFAATRSWEVVGGELAYRCIDAQKIPLGAWLDAVLLICVKGMPSEKITMFMSQLEIAPKGIEVPELEMDMSDFMAMDG